MKMLPAAAAIIGAVISVGAQTGPASRTPVTTTPHFAFFSDFDTNLNDALVAAGLARRGRKPELFHAGDEAACFDKLPVSTRAGWDGAVDYYSAVVSAKNWDSRQQLLIRWDLVGYRTESHPDAAAGEYLQVVAGFRAAAAPAYRACRWSAQDARNRRWIDDMKPRLAADEAQVVARLEQLYKTTWRTLPVLVDVVETVNWSGANTTWSDSGQGDILIASEPGGPSGFETLFHESSHVLMDRNTPVQNALAEAAKAAGVKLPNDLWHVVLFYTTGEAVRPIVEAREHAPYTPMLYGIFARGSWTEYREPLERAWRPYVEGTQSLAQAAAALVAALPKGSGG
jgi:hypothetical protein